MTDIVIRSLISLFFMIFTGFFAGRFKLVNNEMSDELSSLIINVTMPFSIVNSMLRPFDTAFLFNMLIIFLLSVFVHIIFWVIGAVTAKVLHIGKESRGVWLYSLSFSNFMFMGFPVLLALYGNDALFYGSIYGIVFNFLAFSIGIKLLKTSDNENEVFSLRKLLLKGTNVAVVIGLVLFFSQIKIPAELLSGIQGIAGVTTPLSMFAVGLMLSKGKLSDMFHNKSVYILSFIRLIFIPVLLIFMFRCIDVPDILKNTLIVIGAMPVAAITSMLAERYKGNTQLAVNVVFISSILCVFTIPLVVAVLEKFS